MLYFLCEKSSECLKALGDSDTVGCNFGDSPRPHYSGNFWWASAKYLSKLPNDSLTDKMSAEWWVLSGSPNKTVLHNSGKNHFIEAYPSNSYRVAPDTIRYISGGKLGDFIHQLSVVNEMFLKTKKKGIVYLSNIGDNFSFGLERSYKDLYSLVSSQPYISDFKIHNGEEYDINLSTWRNNKLLFHANLHYIFSNEYSAEWGTHPWLFTNKPIKEEFSNIVLIHCIHYRFPHNLDFNKLFQEYGRENVCYITDDKTQYDYFIQKTGINIRLYLADSLDDMIHTIDSCKLYIGNATAPLTYAHGLHKDTIVIIDSPLTLTMFYGLSEFIPNTKTIVPPP
jgi:hypothetical protein